MADPRVTVVIPTLHAGEPLAACLDGLAQQSFGHFQVVVVDNSAARQAAAIGGPPNFQIIANERNVGFGGAINQGFQAFPAELLVCLNDDAVPEPLWLERLVAALDAAPRAGMAAPSIRLADAPDRLDSAGLALYTDGTAKQRGHGRPAAELASESAALIPSGCAAAYRSAMLDEVGLFDADYFLYCEDTDLGLRGRLAGWDCLYVPEAIVRHGYSASAGRASRLKAYHVERNRLWTVVKLFPWSRVLAAPFWAVRRYWEHALAARQGRGLAAEIRHSDVSWRDLAIIVLAAHWNTLLELPHLLRKRRAFRRKVRLSPRELRELLRRFRVSAREIASQ